LHAAFCESRLIAVKIVTTVSWISGLVPHESPRRVLFPNVPELEEGAQLTNLKDWLGGLDSNQDNQIQSLMYCQLYDLPAGGRQ
jgi:hypothetical protein